MKMTLQIQLKSNLALVLLVFTGFILPSDSRATNRSLAQVNNQQFSLNDNGQFFAEPLQIAQQIPTETLQNLTPARRSEIELEVESLVKDQKSLNESLIGAVKRLRETESKTEQTQTQIVELQRRVESIQLSLNKRKTALIEVLAALQRIGKNPPPAVVVQPQDALTAVRSLMLFNSVMPDLRAEADLLTDELFELNQLQKSIERENDQLENEKKRITEEYFLIDALMTAKYAKIIENESLLGKNNLQSQILAENSDTLQELISEIDSNSKSPVVALLDIHSKTIGKGGDSNSIFRDAEREEPAIPFSEARGVLPLPAHGTIVKRFGDDDGNNGRLTGQILATNSGAIISSPCDGWVEFAGQFRSFGNLLILDAGNGYYVLLAGMEKIDVQLGQFVLTGEPIGRMGTEALAQATGSVAQDWEQPVLYIEFRKDDSPINPNPWWGVTSKTKVRG